MTWLAFQELAAPELARELAIADGDFAADRDNAGAALELPSFECAVVDIHVLRLRRNRSTIIWIENHEIGVRTRLDRAFPRKQIEQLGDLRARHIDKRVEVDFTRLHAVGVEQIDAFFERGDAV